jgi:hypothetical protein
MVSAEDVRSWTCSPIHCLGVWKSLASGVERQRSGCSLVYAELCRLCPVFIYEIALSCAIKLRASSFTEMGTDISFEHCGHYHNRAPL